MLRSVSGLAAGVLVAGLIAFAWVKLSPRRVPEGQSRLVTLDEASLKDIRDAFNAGTGEVRVLALLSPT